MRTQLSPGHSRTLPVPFVPQHKRMCGVAALTSIYQYYGQDVDQATVGARVYEPRAGGTINLCMLIDAREQGFSASLEKGSLTRVQECIDSGVPLIVGWRVWMTWHYVVVTGYVLDGHDSFIVFHDGYEANRRMTYAQFERHWKGTGYAALVIRDQEAERFP